MSLTENHIDSIKELLNIVSHIELDRRGGFEPEFHGDDYPGKLRISWDESGEGFEDESGEPICDIVYLSIVTSSDELLETTLKNTTPSGALCLVGSVSRIMNEGKDELRAKLLNLEVQLEHERSEREAAQRTIERLSTGAPWLGD